MSPVPAPDPVAPPGGGLSADYADAIGQLDLTGYNGDTPTLFDPSAVAWDDKGWQAYLWQAASFSYYWSFGDAGGTYDFNGVLSATDSGVSRAITVGAAAGSDADDEGSFFILSASVSPDGTAYTTGLTFGIYHAGGGSIGINLDTDGPTFNATAKVGQTEPLLNLQASDATGVLQVIGNKKIGLYDATPVTQRAHLAPLSESVTVTLITQVAALLNEERARINAISQYLIDLGVEAA